MQTIILKNHFLSLSKILFIQQAHKSIVAQGLLFATSNVGIRLYKGYKSLKKQLKKNNEPQLIQIPKEDPKDVVILNQYPRTYNSPSLSPFAIKLETWLRMANIKYENRLYGKKSSQGLIPWIKLNNEIVEDSQLCIEYLTRVFNKDLDSHLTQEQRAISRSVLKMTDESLKWCLAYHRFWLSNNRNETNLPSIAYWLMSFKVYLGVYFQGYARFNTNDFYNIGRKDLKALNDLIGDKNHFLFGYETPSTIDASVFGMCVQFVYRDLGPLHEYVITECPNILRYVKNMKDLYWKDWDLIVLKHKEPQKKSLVKSLIASIWKK